MLRLASHRLVDMDGGVVVVGVEVGHVVRLEMVEEVCVCLARAGNAPVPVPSCLILKYRQFYSSTP